MSPPKAPVRETLPNSYRCVVNCLLRFDDCFLRLKVVITGLYSIGYLTTPVDSNQGVARYDYGKSLESLNLTVFGSPGIACPNFIYFLNHIDFSSQRGCPF